MENLTNRCHQMLRIQVAYSVLRKLLLRRSQVVSGPKELPQVDLCMEAVVLVSLMQLVYPH